jgi:hypothetical protein
VLCSWAERVLRAAGLEAEGAAVVADHLVCGFARGGQSRRGAASRLCRSLKARLVEGAPRARVVKTQRGGRSSWPGSGVRTSQRAGEPIGRGGRLGIRRGSGSAASGRRQRIRGCGHGRDSYGGAVGGRDVGPVGWTSGCSVTGGWEKGAWNWPLKVTGCSPLRGESRRREPWRRCS